VNDGTEESQQVHDRHSDLLGRLRAVVSGADGVPAEMIAAARASYMWHTIDAELAELAYDSLVDAGARAVVRSSGGARVLAFESATLAIELEATGTGGARRVVGQVIPPQRARIDVRHAGGVTTVDTDHLGGFAAGELTPGPASIRCKAVLDGGPTVVDTDWFLI
jgi:hypothetical protein